MMKWYHSRWVRWCRDSIIVLVGFALLSYWQTRDMLATDGSEQVQPASLIGLDGMVHHLFQSSDNTKPTLVYFFAPWCNVCKHSMGNLDELDKNEINIVRIALDYRSEQQVDDFVMNIRAQGPILLGNNDIKSSFRVSAYPSYYLLDSDFKVSGRAKGYSTEWGMKLKTYLLN